MEEYDLLTKAKANIVINHPFYSALLLSMPLVRNDAVGTFAVNGKIIQYNKEFMEKLSVNELVGCLCHEVMHIALMHSFRIKERDPVLWNMAGDYVINLDLKNNKNNITLPQGVLCDPKYAGMSTEEVYRELRKNAKKEASKNKGATMAGDLQPPPGNACEQAAAEQMARVEVTRAIAAAKSMGALPASLEKQVVESLAEQSRWREQLREFFTEPLKDDQSWNRGQRRFLHSGLYLPALYSLGLGTVAVILDSSGSCVDEAPVFLGEVSSLGADCKPKELVLIQVDAKVQNVQHYAPGETINSKVYGGGGTNMCRGFDYIDEHNIDPAICIVLTDLMTPFPDTPPEYPVLWVSVCQGQAPFGDVIYM